MYAIRSYYANLERRYRESTSDYVRSKLEDYMVNRPCSTCDGTRLQPVARAVDIDGETISELARKPVVRILKWVTTLRDEASYNFV